MAAFDNVSLASPPNIATAGNYAQMLMQGLSAIPQDYQRGQEFQYQQRQRNLFQDADSQAMLQDALQNRNYAPLVQKIAQSGGASSIGLIEQLMQLQNQTEAGRDLAKLSQPGGGLNTGPTASVAAASPASLTPGAQSQPQISSAGMDNAGAETVRSLTAGIAGGRPIPDAAIGTIASRLGVDPDAPLSAAQETQARRLIGGNIGGGSQPMGSPGGTPGVSAPTRGGIKPVVGSTYDQDETNPNHLPPSMGEGSSAVSPRPTSGAGGFGPSATGNIGGTPGQSFDSRFNAAYGGGPAATRPSPLGTAKDADALDDKARALYAFSARPMIAPAQAEAARKMGDQFVAQAREIRSQLGTYNAPATNPEIQGQLHRFEGASKAVGDQIGEYVKQMPAMRQMVNQLDIIDDAVKSAKGNLTTGPGAEAMLKMKQFLSNLGVPVQGMAQAEVIQKMNAYLASEAARQLTNRPSQNEFRAFRENNPSIMNSIQGTLILSNILRQSANQTLGLGKLGMNQKNWEAWGDVEDRYFAQHPIKLPFSGNPAGGQTGGVQLPKGVRSIQLVQ